MKTRPPKPVVGEATAIRQAAAAAATPQDTSAIDTLVYRYSRPNQADASTSTASGRNGDTAKQGSGKTSNS